VTTELETSATHIGDPREAPSVTFTGTDRFEVVRELGAGGMGIVYLAHDRERARDVALKTLGRLDAQALYRFKHEFRSLADLSHPNLIELGELVGEDDQWFFTMEFVDGVDFVTHARPAGRRRVIDGYAATRVGDPRSIDTLMAIDPPAEALPSELALVDDEYDESRLRAALAQLVSGLKALHEAGKVHRDVKPANVLCTAAGRVIVLDFGLVTDYRERDVEDGTTICGTPDYMAPEQVALEPVGPPADWYAVGVMLYEVLTGALPFSGVVASLLWQKLHAVPPPLPDSAPPDLAALCRDLLARDPALRPTAHDILHRLHVDQGEDEGPHEHAFVGRDRELAQLAQLFARSRERPTMVVVSGESGLGKTALVHEFLARCLAAEPGTRVLHSRCFERESVPYKAFDGAVDALSRVLLQDGGAIDELPDAATLAALRRVFPVLRRVRAIAAAPDEPGQGNVTEQRWLAFRGLRELLTRLAARAPLIVCIDDLHWADGDSLVLLEELLAATATPLRALFLATSRTMVEVPSATATPVEIPLVALTTAESERLVAALVRDGAAATIAREARGHPLFIRELCVRPHGAAAARSVEEALHARVQAQDPAVQRLMEVIAIAAAPIAQATAAAAAGLELGEGSRCVAALRRAHLCRTLGARPGDPVEPYHDRVRQAVLARMSPEARADHSRRLAELLEQDGAGESAPHLLVQLFAASGDLPRAARHAEHAAAAAARALAFEHAAQLYRSALEYGAQDPARTRRLSLTLAETLGHAGLGADAAAVYLAIAEQADDASIALRCRAEAACHQLGCGLVDEGLATAARVLGELGQPWPATQRHAVTRLLWHRLRLRLRGLEFRERTLAEIPEATLVRLDTFDQIATNVGAIDPLTAGAFQARALHLALDAGERGRIVRALAKEALFIALGGVPSLPRATAVVARVRRLALADQPEHAAWTSTATGFVAYLTGDFAAAYPNLADAERRFTAGPVRHFAGLLSVRLFRLNAARLLGKFAEIHSSLSGYLRDAVHRGDRHAQNSLTRALNSAWLVEDNPDEARRRIDASTWVAEARGLHQQHLYDLFARVDLALYTADRPALARLLDDARRIARSLLVRVQSNRVFVRHTLGRLALALAEATGDPRHLALAEHEADALAAEGVLYATLFAHLLRAGIAVQRGDIQRATAALHAVVAGSAGLELFAALARHRLAELAGVDTSAAAAPLRREGVLAPARLIQTFAPGFTPR